MSAGQITAFAILGITLVMLIWGRWRYDVVAVFALLTCVLTGLVPAAKAFEGFAHPAVLTVVGVLILSRGLQNAGIVDVAVKLMASFKGKPLMQLAGQTTVIAVLSAFMNNVGALAIMMPVALRNAYREGYAPSMTLMPLAFGSLLGGLTTLIGTPPNIIVSNFRQEAAGRPFQMFDFAPVGSAIAVAGIVFIVLVGWRLIPQNTRAASGAGAASPLDIKAYITEVVAEADSPAVGRTVQDIEAPGEGEVIVVAIVRAEVRYAVPAGHETVEAGDVLILEGGPDALKVVIDESGLSLVGDKTTDGDNASPDAIGVVEAIVASNSRLIGRSPTMLRLRTIYGVNLLAVARHGRRINTRLRDVVFQSGDILLLQGPDDRMAEILTDLQCLPLAERRLGIGRPRRLLLAAGLFAGAIAVIVLDMLQPHVAFIGAAALMTASGLLKPDEVYQAIDWPVIVLIGALFPVGAALESTGSTALIANTILYSVGGLAPVWGLVILLVATMCISDVINNNAAALLMAPVGMGMASQLGTSIDPFLMAVAIGSSCAFLTPIGHQNNALIMDPGGYRFGDYWRMGLPLEVIIVLVSVPAILLVWPL